MARYLRTPTEPPALPEGQVGMAVSFRPSLRWLRYLKVTYFMGLAGLVLVFGSFMAFFLVILAREGSMVVAAILAPLVGGLFVFLALWSWWSIQLRYDTTWYAMTDRALRVRTGIWIIREQTVSFDNVQNVRVRRGPIQRWIGIGDVTIETAAAGVTDSQSGTSTASGATIQGVDDPGAIRDRIVSRMRESRGAGLGEDGPDGVREARTSAPARQGDPGAGPAPPESGGARPGWTGAHVAVLREIRDEVRRLPGG